MLIKLTSAKTEVTLCRHTAQCRVQGEVYRLLGAVLVVKSDSSRKEGPAIPLLHTLRVCQSVRSCPVLR